LMVSDILLYL